jgi:hypothetical protein
MREWLSRNLVKSWRDLKMDFRETIKPSIVKGRRGEWVRDDEWVDGMKRGSELLRYLASSLSFVSSASFSFPFLLHV